MSDDAKKFFYLNRKAPYGSIYALESLEVVLIGAAFEQQVSLGFVDDGVYQLIKGQNTKSAGMKNFSSTYRALGDYDVRNLYVEKESLDERGLTIDNLMPITHDTDDEEDLPSIHVVTRAEMADIMAGQDVVLSF
ncbi:MAG: sulfurtransferase complex subunit TusC [Rhizobiaceae bacterium]